MNAEHPIEFTPPVSVGIGVLGGAAFIAREAVLPAIDAADGAHLAAIASQSGTIDPRWGGRQVDGYDDVLAHADVEAVYLPLSNGLHEEWTIKAALAGKHVLCEKPVATTTAGRVGFASARSASSWAMFTTFTRAPADSVRESRARRDRAPRRP